MKKTRKFFYIFISFISFVWIFFLGKLFVFYLYEKVSWIFQIQSKGKYFVHPTASLRNSFNIIIGVNSRINYNCTIWAGESNKIILGDNLLMGPNVSIQAVNHGIKSNIPIKLQKRIGKGNVIISNDCWLGANVTILSGVKIAEGVIVAANSVVTKNIDIPFSIWGGVPAKFIKYRE